MAFSKHQSFLIESINAYIKYQFIDYPCDILEPYNYLTKKDFTIDNKNHSRKVMCLSMRFNLVAACAWKI